MSSGNRIRWTSENVGTAVSTLRQHSSMGKALEEISNKVGFEVTEDSIYSALSRNGLESAYSYLKKATYVSRRPVASDPEDAEAETDESEELDEVEEYRLKSQVTELNAAKKRLLGDLADREEQIQVLKELRAAKPLPPIVERASVGSTQRQGVPVLLCSDWHVEEPVDPKAVNGLNEYNLEIAEGCIDRMSEAYAWLLKDMRYDCRTGIIWLGGDLFSGWIHQELTESNFLSPVQATLWLQERIERMLRKIAASCPQLDRITVICNDGNHGRLTHKIRVSTRTANSLEWLMYHNIAARMADDARFEFQIADGEWSFIEVYGSTLAFTHGDSFRYGGGVGGISIPLKKGINEMRKYRPIHHVSLGHFHQRSDFGDITVNGSMIGVSPYSMHIHASPEVRQQSFFLWDSKRGKSLTAPVWI